MSARRTMAGFIAGVLAAPLFNQTMLWLLHGIGLTPRTPFAWDPTPPFAVPAVVSLAFWGGVWGILFAAVERRFPAGLRYWATTLLFGAVLPTLVAWFVVAPLKGQPLAAGGQLPAMATVILINAAWAMGTAVLFRLWLRRSGPGSSRRPA